MGPTERPTNFFAPPFFSVQPETGLNLLPPYSEAKIACERPELQRHRLHGSSDELVMLRGQPLERPPAHPLRFLAASVQNARLPPQPRPKFVSPPCCAVAYVLACTGVGE